MSKFGLLLFLASSAFAAATVSLQGTVTLVVSGDPGPPVWAQAGWIHGTVSDMSGWTATCDDEDAYLHIGTYHTYSGGYERLLQVGVEPDIAVETSACTLYQNGVPKGWTTADPAG